MNDTTRTLAGALIAGLIGGAVALADDTQPAVPGNATPKTQVAKKRRKPHNGIKNKNSCGGKNGCGGAMDAPKK